MLRTLRSKADEINHCIHLERRDARAECSCLILHRPVNLDALYRLPGGMRHIRLAFSAAGDDYLVPRVDEPRDKERADVTSPADDDNSHGGHTLAMIQRCRIRCGQLSFAFPDVKTINESRRIRVSESAS